MGALVSTEESGYCEVLKMTDPELLITGFTVLICLGIYLDSIVHESALDHIPYGWYSIDEVD